MLSVFCIPTYTTATHFSPLFFFCLLGGMLYFRKAKTYTAERKWKLKLEQKVIRKPKLVKISSPRWESVFVLRKGRKMWSLETAEGYAGDSLANKAEAGPSEGKMTTRFPTRKARNFTQACRETRFGRGLRDTRPSRFWWTKYGTWWWTNSVSHCLKHENLLRWTNRVWFQTSGRRWPAVPWIEDSSLSVWSVLGTYFERDIWNLRILISSDTEIRN